MTEYFQYYPSTTNNDYLILIKTVMKLEFQSIKTPALALEKVWLCNIRRTHLQRHFPLPLYVVRESGEKQSGHLLSLTCDRALIGKAADRVSCKRAPRALAKNQQKSITSRFVNSEFRDTKVLSDQICQRRTHCCILASLKVACVCYLCFLLLI